MGDPKQAFDYPLLDDDLWVIWSSNAYKWPDGRRSMSYFTEKRSVSNLALFSMLWCEAVTFTSQSSAVVFLASEEDRRPFLRMNVTTVADLKIARGYI